MIIFTESTYPQEFFNSQASAFFTTQNQGGKKADTLIWEEAAL